MSERETGRERKRECERDRQSSWGEKGLKKREEMRGKESGVGDGAGAVREIERRGEEEREGERKRAGGGGE